MKTTIKALSFAAILAVAAAPAAHATEQFNHALGGPGVYYGSTTFDGGWTILTTNNTPITNPAETLQLGLEAITRFVGPITPSSNDYTYAPGPGTSSNLATWDFAFSVNTGSLPLSAFTYSITISDDLTHASYSFDPTTTLGDNAQANAGGVVCNGCAYNGTNNGMQNAENLGFSFIGGPLGFNPNSSDGYTITLTANPGAGTDFEDPSVTIDVVAPKVIPPTVPEPSSLMLLGTGLLSVVGAARRKFKA